MLTIYGSRGSSSANKVEYTALALGLKYEYKTIDIQKDSKTEWYMKIHPAGKVPALDDDGFVLFESNAMMTYLADKKPGNLFPKDAKKRAIVNQWVEFVSLQPAQELGKMAFAKMSFRSVARVPRLHNLFPRN